MSKLELIQECYIEAIAFFQKLHSDEKQIQKLLVERKQNLVNIDIDSMSEEELHKQLDCYVWLFEAFHETNPRTKFSLVYKLFSCFEEEIVTELQMGTLTVEEEIEEEIEVEEETLTHDELVDTILYNLDSTLNLNIKEDDDNEQRNHEEIYQEMLIQQKLHCATTYVKALSNKIPQYESVYRQLAYAVNDPMEVCTYNSDTVYNVFYNETYQMSDHYAIAATIRNYFLDQFNYDYSLKLLHSMIVGSPVLAKNQELSELIYTLLQFKADYYVGVDKYADYREKEQALIEEQLEKTCRDAKMIYQNYFVDAVKENIDNRRYMQMLKLVFTQKSDLGQYLNMIVNKEDDMLDMLREGLREHYIKDNAQICEENIDLWKINREIDRYWELSKTKMNSVRETADLMSELRTNAAKKIQKVVSIMARYVFLIDSSTQRNDTQILHAYKKLRKSLLELIEVSREKLIIDEETSLENRAGNAVLIATLNELEVRLIGTYEEGSNKYFYIDFLKNDKVLLDEMFFPVLDEVLELPALSLANRVLNHSQEEGMSWDERMSSILNGEDDYGSAKLILQYLEEKNIKLQDSRLQNFDIEKAVIYPQKDTDNKRKNFIEELEFAQSYGKIDNTVENSKEMMIQVMETWFEWANQTNNYGFFAKILEAFYEQIENDAQVRAIELDKNLKVYLEQNPEWSENDLVCKVIKQIQDRIEKQNYTAAEDLMNRLVNEDLESNIDINSKDYLEEFFNEYETNYRKSIQSLGNNVITTRRMNKDIKGANRLLEYWPKGFGMKVDSMKIFLDSLGFAIGEVVSEEPIQGKMDCFFVTLKRPENGKKSNYKHPISAFGSEAEEKGFRVVCVFGNTDASRLIDICNEIGNAKNTLILLNHSLTLADRRRLARKTKTDLSGKIFAVMDKVVLTYLAKHYVDTAVNRMLMHIIMPFASYQPYIDKSADVMPQEIFIGRKAELEKIESPTGVNIVYGGRQLGKTALLRMAQKDIDKNENGDRAVLVSVWGKNYREAAKAVSETMHRENVLKNVPVTDDWDTLASQIKDRLYEEENKIPYLLLMIDEADTFIESCESIRYKPFEALKDIQSIGHGRFKFVVAGLRNIVRFKKESALSDNVGLVHLKSLTVKPFKTMEARELLELPLSYLGFRFPRDSETEVLISTIFGTTNYFPGLIQLYCTKLIEAMKRDYAGYSESETPPYIVQKEHIKKVLAEQTLQQDIRDKFFITLKVGDDDYYYIIALLVAYLYHENKTQNGCSAKQLLELAEGYSIQKLLGMTEEQIWALMEEMCELNVLQHIGEGRYRFTRHSFCQMMGTFPQIEDELFQYMEE